MARTAKKAALKGESGAEWRRIMGKASRNNTLIDKAWRLVKYVTEVLTVSKCPSCHELVRYTGTLCPECLEKYKKEREKGCIYCGLPATECVCSTRELKHCKPFDKSLHSYVFYDREHKVFQNLLYRLKKDTDRSAEKFFARELSVEIMKLALTNRQHLAEWYVTYPSRSKNAVLDYGFDQSEGLAKRISEYTGMTFERVFERSKDAKTPQKDLGGAMRRANAEKMFFLKNKSSVKGKKYIIIDDVVTTGSTLRQCQKLLLNAGAKHVFPVAIAKTYFRGVGHDGPRERRKRPDTTWFM